MTNSRKYFSQNGEDFLLHTALDGDPAYFVDVGAFDGIHLSNSWSFELAGWPGLCIEANPRFAKLCAQQRPNSDVIQAACVAPGGPDVVTFLSEPLGLLSGLQADLTEGMERRYRNRDMTFEGFVPIEVPAVTLAAALGSVDAPEQIGFISIDVEGTETDVLHGFDFEKYRCSIFVVEANTEQAGQQIGQQLGAFGFVEYRRLGENRFFAASPQLGELLATTTVDCIVEDALHPDGESATHPLHRGRHILNTP